MGLLRAREASPPPAPRDTGSCLAALRSVDAVARRAAALELAGEGAAVPALLALLPEEGDAEVRSAILGALVETAGAAAATGLVALLRHADIGLRNGAAEALRQMGAEAGPPVLRLLADPDPDLRLAAIGALLGIPNDGGALRSLLARETEAQVLFAAIEALGSWGVAADAPLLRALAQRFPAEPSIAFAVALACRRLEGPA